MGQRVTARVDAGAWAGGHSGTPTGVIHSLSQWSDRFIPGGGRRSAPVKPAIPEPRPDRRPRRPALPSCCRVRPLSQVQCKQRSAMEGRVLLRVSGSRGRLPAGTTVARGVIRALRTRADRSSLRNASHGRPGPDEDTDHSATASRLIRQSREAGVPLRGECRGRRPKLQSSTARVGSRREQRDGPASPRVPRTPTATNECIWCT